MPWWPRPSSAGCWSTLPRSDAQRPACRLLIEAGVLLPLLPLQRLLVAMVLVGRRGWVALKRPATGVVVLRWLAFLGWSIALQR